MPPNVSSSLTWPEWKVKAAPCPWKTLFRQDDDKNQWPCVCVLWMRWQTFRLLLHCAHAHLAYIRHKDSQPKFECLKKTQNEGVTPAWNWNPLFHPRLKTWTLVSSRNSCPDSIDDAKLPRECCFGVLIKLSCPQMDASMFPFSVLFYMRNTPLCLHLASAPRRLVIAEWNKYDRLWNIEKLFFSRRSAGLTCELSWPFLILAGWLMASTRAQKYSVLKYQHGVSTHHRERPRVSEIVLKLWAQSSSCFIFHLPQFHISLMGLFKWIRCPVVKVPHLSSRWTKKQNTENLGYYSSHSRNVYFYNNSSFSSWNGQI